MLFSLTVNHTNTVKFLLNHVLPKRSESNQDILENNENPETPEILETPDLLYTDEVTEDEIHAAVGKDMLMF